MPSGIRTRTSGIMVNVAMLPPITAVASTPIQDLINGLTADGVFAKLDRLWIFAQATEGLALVDIIASATATNVNSTTFTANLGYTGNGSSMYIDSNIGGGGTINFSQNSACYFGWSNTTGTDTGPLFATNTNVSFLTRMYPRFTDDLMRSGLNGVAATNPSNAPDATGLYLLNRTAAGTYTVDINGALFDTQAVASSPPETSDFTALKDGSGFGSRQICCFGFGGGLSAGDRTNLYSRLRTYMTAVGVP